MLSKKVKRSSRSWALNRKAPKHNVRGLRAVPSFPTLDLAAATLALLAGGKTK